ncbi:MAG: phosphotransferase family protein [Actinomycetota bacterium]|nr:phosphotransferase family protein [Actinomycetota bacterium]
MEGIKEPNVSDWISRNVANFQGPYDYQLIAGGRSNLTFQVTDAKGEMVILRRPPISHVLPTAHDMTREHRILTGLDKVVFPSPKPIALCTDNDVNDYPFYIMEKVDGHILKEEKYVEATFPTLDDRRKMSENLVSTLVKLHSFDPDEIGLSDLGRKDGYIERQLKRWFNQYQASGDEINHRVPLVEDMHQKLVSAVPEQAKSAIVHGDYRLDNTLITNDCEVAAVLDWEICTLGDPLADIGLLLVYWTEKTDQHPPLASVTQMDGFATRSEIAKLYAEMTGVDLSLINYYVSFGYWKLACILEGVYSRYVQGARGGDRSEVGDYAKQVQLLAEASKEAFERF